MQHQVQKLTLEINFDDEANAYALQSRIAHFAQTEVTRIIDQLFSEFSHEYQRAHISKLELDLGSFVLDDKLELSIHKSIKEQLHTKLIDLFNFGTYSEPDSIPEIIDIPQNEVALFTYFLETGNLPWNAQVNGASISISGIFNQIIEKHPDLLKKASINILSHKHIQLRLIRQFSDIELLSLTGLWVNKKGKHQISGLTNDLYQIFKYSPLLKNTFYEYRELIWQFFFQETILKGRNTENLHLDIVQFFSKELFIPLEGIIESILINSMGLSKSKTFQTPFIARIKKQAEATEVVPAINISKVITPQLIQRLQSLLKKNKISKTLSQTKALALQLYKTFILKPNRGNTIDGFRDYLVTQLAIKYAIPKQAVFLEINKPIVLPAKATKQQIKKTLRETMPSLYEALPELTQRLQGILKENAIRLTRLQTETLVLQLSKDFIKKNSQVTSSKSDYTAYLIKQLASRFSIPEQNMGSQEVWGNTKNELIAFKLSKSITQQNLSSKEIFLSKVLATLPFQAKPSHFSSLIRETEKALQDFFKRPLLLKRILVLSRFNIHSFQHQLLLNAFSKEIKSILLKKYFNLSLPEFELIKKETIRNEVEAFFATANFKSFIHNNLISSIFEQYANLWPKKFKKLAAFKENSPEVKSKKLKVLRTFVEKDFFNKHFNTAKETVSAKKVNIQEISGSTEIIGILNEYLKEKEYPAFYTFTLTALVSKLFRTSQTIATRYFCSLSEEQSISITNKLENTLAEKIKTERKEAIEILAVRNIEEIEYKEEPYKVASDEPVYISNAGLIIVHPFLIRFFTLSGLVENKKFVDEHARHTATHLLHYLTTKTENPEEHALFLNKILCGIPPETPILKDIKISKAQKETAEGLLQGVIGNWTALKNSSADNLRGSFLIRNGRLLAEDQVWHLKVEEKAYDILINKLPWGIGMIKLPWMQKTLNTEWK